MEKVGIRVEGLGIVKVGIIVGVWVLKSGFYSRVWA